VQNVFDAFTPDEVLEIKAENKKNLKISEDEAIISRKADKEFIEAEKLKAEIEAKENFRKQIQNE
jgi:hypothetical protein